MKLSWIVVIFAALIAMAWAGLLVKPEGFEQRFVSDKNTKTIPVPTSLPFPVERFFHAYFGETMPETKTVVFTGRGKIRPFGIWLPARFVFVHKAGQGYRHYIEATWFGLPFLKVNEGIVDGASFFESPMGNTNNDPNTNQGANLALWAEAGWFPSILATDARLRWQAVDNLTALLFVPYGDITENFVVRFNPESGLIDTMEAMRFRESGEGKPKILWITRNEAVEGKRKETILASGSATWLDQGKPWAYFNLETAAYNVDIEAYIRARGE
ncbi:MAG: DUF6544 family protein [Spirochaetales bacterium]